MAHQKGIFENENVTIKWKAAGKRPEVEDDSNGDDPRPIPSKRQKRGKYVSRACDQCQRRKIKCDGSMPCAPCSLNRRDCDSKGVDMRRRYARSPLRASQDPYSAQVEERCNCDNNQIAIRDLSARLDQLERLVRSTILHEHGQGELKADSEPSTHRPIARENQSETIGMQQAAYSGETPIPYTLNQLEANLARLRGHEALATGDAQSHTYTPVLTPAPSPTRSGKAGHSVLFSLRKTLQKYGVEPSGAHWETYLNTFCDGVHTMYPFLHLPSLWRQYRDMWQTMIEEPSITKTLGGRDEEITMAQTFICLAIGRCTASPRIAGAEARHSAGWSLYSAAMDLFGDILSSFEECSNQVAVLQTLALMVVYLFRLDIIEKAEKLLALSISHAYHLGLHRYAVATMNGMTRADTEISRRLWWCLYIMDRRLAIETGRPFMIQDLNLDTPLPRDLDDDHVHYHQSEWSNSSDCSFQRRADIPAGFATPIPYLTAMVAYSRVLGKVWEGVYSAKDMGSPPSPQLCEHLEHLISRAQKGVPKELRYHSWQKEAQSKSSVWWLSRQQTLMRVRWLSLRLMIRKPMLQQKHSFSFNEFIGVENELVCMQIACESIRECLEVPLEQVVFTFPFLHYLISAAIVSTGLLIGEPSLKQQYGQITLKAVQVLEAHFRKTWVSGKLIRSVLELSKILSQVLRDGNHIQPLRNASTLNFEDSCSLADPNGCQWRGSFPTVQSANKRADSESLVRPAVKVNQKDDIRTECPIIQSEQLNKPAQSQEEALGSGPPGLSVAASSFAPSIGFTDLMADFFFEENARSRTTPNDLLIQRDSNNIKWPLGNSEFEGVDGSSETLRCRLHRDDADTTRAAERQLDPGECVASDMQWLEAIFGDYLDSELIIRPGE